MVIFNFTVSLRDGDQDIDQKVTLRFPEELGKQKDPMSPEIHREACDVAIRRYRKEHALPNNHSVLSHDVRFERGRIDKAR